jgi:uncharacterized protein YjbJ (UPF0337 family)
METKTKLKAKPKKATEEFKITGNWVEQAKSLKAKFPKLTDTDLKFEAGKEDQLLSRLATALNKKKDEVINLIKKGATK